ncbi:putative RNA-dependent RNA polymerase 1 [Glomus cerebriforme]|uniref:RNA-dependent RNA polymerase n=1 Tax=Glomus cerebriforme TaxID=658196 RepID=A0A397SG62_9GLOM|nr:putative RNA-dependent RNA polymerase 1 [Glomus cerebriforme]
MYILEKMLGGQKRIYDPLSYLYSEIEKLYDISINSEYIPPYCSMMRKVVVTPTTMYMLAPNAETSNRVIRHFQDKKDNFLRVHFSDEASNKIGSLNGNHNDTCNDALYNRIYYTLKNGIKIGNNHYEFLAFSSSQLRDHSCWFFASTQDLTADNIRRWMGDFSDIKTIAKYSARMGQCFSSTRAIQRLPVDDIEEIPDIIRHGYTFSDGVGKISYSLANKIAQKLELKSIPSAFQFRMAGYKGVLCQSRYLRENQVQVRPSQQKFKSNHNVLEIIRCSSYLPAYLNRQAITLLSALGIPDEIFIKMKDKQVNDLSKIFESEKTALDLLQQNIDEYGISKSLVELVKAGFLQTKDPYLINLISLFRITTLRDLKKKAKIRVGEGAFLMGVIDETKTLKEDEVYCCVTDPYNPSNRKLITGKCIVFRNPCFHPGDVRIVTAVDCKTLSNLKDVLVFPAVGFRDIPNQCSGGDLDGDDFTLIYDKQLIPKKVYEPMNYRSPKLTTVDKVTMDDIKTFFVNYLFSDQLGKIANSHLAKADYFPTGAFHGQCIRLAHLHSEAVDFPKTGVPANFPLELRADRFPDFMEKPDKPTYKSEKVLGTLYRSIKEEKYQPYTHLNFDKRLYVEGYEEYLKDAQILKSAYDAAIKGVMNQFGIMTEFEAVSGYIIDTITKVDKKKPRDVSKSVMDVTVSIRKHYRKEFEEEFYDEGTNVVSSEAFDRMESKAYAWYFVTYNNLKDGDMISFPWIVYDILCKIAKKNNSRSI